MDSRPADADYESHAGKISCQLNCENRCIDVLRSMVAEMSRKAGLDACHSNRVELAVDELFANIAQHGYGGSPGHIEFEADIRTYPDGRRMLVFELRDFVVSDWNYVRAQPAACAPEKIRPGGLGLRLIEAVVDRFEQRKLGDGNRWRLVFFLND